MAKNSASKKSKSSSKNSQDQQKQTRKPGELSRFQKVVIVLFVVVFAMSTLAGALASVFQSSQTDQTTELTVDNIDSQFESTVADLENKVSENPEDTTSLRSLGDNYMTWGSYVKVLAENDADTEHSNELFEKAISAYDKILELGDDSDVRINRAMCQSYMGDFDDSIAALTELTETEPDNASAWLNLGVVYRSNSQDDKALEVLNKAIELDPDDAEGIKSHAESIISSITGEDTTSDDAATDDTAADDTSDDTTADDTTADTGADDTADTSSEQADGEN